MINDIISPVERGPIIDVNQQGVNLSCLPLLTGSGSGDGASVRWVALTNHSILDFVVALEGGGGKNQLESLTMCVDISNDIHDCIFCLRSREVRSMCVARVMFESGFYNI